MISEKQILEKKQYGDIALVAQMLTKQVGKYISTNNTTQILNRPNSKHYQKAIEALRQIIESREQLLNEIA